MGRARNPEVWAPGWDARGGTVRVQERERGVVVGGDSTEGTLDAPRAWKMSLLTAVDLSSSRAC